MSERENHTRTPAPTRRIWPRILVATVVVAAVLGGALYWFFGGDPPAEVDLSATADKVTSTDSTSESGVTSVDGTWTVTTDTGTFDIEDATATFAGFRVDEELASIGAATAVGRTPEVSGTIQVEGTSLTAADIEADLTAIVSDQSRRDDAIQRALNTGSNPTATFTLTAPIELGNGAAAGEMVSVTASGDLTINGMTNPVDIDLEAQLVNGMILVTGSTPITFADYGVDAPTSPAVLSVEDNGTLEFQLWLTQG